MKTKTVTERFDDNGDLYERITEESEYEESGTETESESPQYPLPYRYYYPNVAPCTSPYIYPTNPPYRVTYTNPETVC